MDLGISGKHALVCGASKGLGRGCAEALAKEGVNVHLVARNKELLEKTAIEIIQKTKNKVVVKTTSADITDKEDRDRVLNSCKKIDILVTNAGGPPPGDFRSWDKKIWMEALNANMFTPIDLIKSTVDDMMNRGFGRIINITSSAVKAPIDILGLSNGARAGLTGFIAGISRTTIEKNVTINNLLPGPFDTDRLRSTFDLIAKNTGKSFEFVFESKREANPAKRFGNIEEFGAFCAFISSIHASYLTGQNFLIDGGSYPGTF
tara:strand:- start:4592 stop:5377 length:786 start_codon:yes stop_codon:yes gene_type:complete